MKLLSVLLLMIAVPAFYSAAQPMDILAQQPAPMPGEAAAQDAAISETPAAAPEDAPAAQAAELAADARDPFWPVGFSPKVVEEEVQSSAAEVQQAVLEADEELWITLQKRLNIAGVAVVGSRKMATINNKLVEVGGIISIRHEGREFRWKISEITDTRRVRFSRLDVVPVQ